MNRHENREQTKRNLATHRHWEQTRKLDRAVRSHQDLLSDIHVNISSNATATNDMGTGALPPAPRRLSRMRQVTFQCPSLPSSSTDPLPSSSSGPPMCAVSEDASDDGSIGSQSSPSSRSSQSSEATREPADPNAARPGYTWLNAAVRHDIQMEEAEDQQAHSAVQHHTAQLKHENQPEQPEQPEQLVLSDSD